MKKSWLKIFFGVFVTVKRGNCKAGEGSWCWFLAPEEKIGVAHFLFDLECFEEGAWSFPVVENREGQITFGTAEGAWFWAHRDARPWVGVAVSGPKE